MFKRNPAIKWMGSWSRSILRLHLWQWNNRWSRIQRVSSRWTSKPSWRCSNRSRLQFKFVFKKNKRLQVWPYFCWCSEKLWTCWSNGGDCERRLARSPDQRVSNHSRLQDSSRQQLFVSDTTLLWVNFF